jgi:hypothetical protein
VVVVVVEKRVVSSWLVLRPPVRIEELATVAVRAQ